MSPEAHQAFEAHALASYPREACGVLAGAGYVPCVNSARNTLADFAISPAELTRVTLQHGPIAAYLHTHPYDPRQVGNMPPETPSHLDQSQWMAGTTPWAIAATDGTGISQLNWLDDSNRPPLFERDFKWVTADCYAAIRDWFLVVLGIHLKNYPRQWDFHKQGQTLYDDQFADAGFVEIKPEQVQVGDCVLMRHGSRIATHAAVITGPDEIFHHVMHQQSGYDSLFTWHRQITKYLRYAGEVPTC